VTFCVAGLQKFADPTFFDRSNPAGIYAQMVGAERSSPLHPLLGHLLAVSTLVGVLIALGELAVGIGTLLGLFSRIAAAGGALISLSLFLTVSWSASPYYTGADIAFFFAWLPLVLAGAGGVWSLDGVIRNRTRAERDRPSLTPVVVPFGLVQRICGNYEAGRCAARRGAPCSPGPCPFLHQNSSPPSVDGELTRRQLVRSSAAALGAAMAGMIAAGAAAGIGRVLGRAAPSTPGATLPPVTRSTGRSATTTSTTPRDAGGTTPPGSAIGPATEVPLGSWAAFTDPTSGDPSLVIHLSDGRFVAYDAVCPHAGCTVGYSPSERLIVCPCHGSEFDPSSGAVVQGPATRGLRRFQVTEGTNGQLYVEE